MEASSPTVLMITTTITHKVHFSQGHVAYHCFNTPIEMIKIKYGRLRQPEQSVAN